MKKNENIKTIDHIALAVHDLDESITFFEKIGFKLLERRTTTGAKTQMISAVMKTGQVLIVLTQGISKDSQISRYIENYGSGIQHIAFEVESIYKLNEQIKAEDLEFETGIIECEGTSQRFLKRDPNTGMMIEFIERKGEKMFCEESVDEIFKQLEANNSF